MRRAGWMLLVLLAACSDISPVTQLPDPPSPLFLPDEYAFGGSTQIADAEASRAVESFIEGQLDRGDLKPTVQHWVAPAGTDFAALMKGYDEAAAKAGWQPMAGLKDNLWAGGSGVAYRHGEQAFAILWINAASASGNQPVTVIRYGDDA